MAKKPEGTENLPAVISEENYPILGQEIFSDVLAALQSVRDSGEAMSMRSLARVKVPAGGGTVWKFPTAEGNKNVETFEGVIVASIQSRAYWKDSGASSVPPDCSSTDMKIGNGPEMGVRKCETCEFNQYGTANGGKGKGKACREVRNLLILTPNATMPLLLIVPPTSLNALKNYHVSLFSRPPVRTMHGVVTTFGLKEITGGANPYSEIVFTLAGPLDNEYNKMMGRYADMIKQAFEGGVSHEAPDFGE